MLIVNADDFGLSHEVNLAVIRSFEQGFCTSCSIMPNMPGFEEACELARVHGLADRVGLHLVLTEGSPVTGPLKECPRFCDRQGRLRLSRQQRVLRLAGRERRAVEQEIEGQIARCRRHGIAIAHLDSHNHAHEEWALAPLVIEAARQARIPRLRLCRTAGRGASRVKQWYRRLVNLRIRAAGLAATACFGSPDDYAFFRQSGGASKGRDRPWEVMIHPALDQHGRLVDSWLGRPLEDVMEGLN